ncbi:MAG TPA: copper homeostasis protein CutC [Candidatus Avipropionibacterium avicola]|uniref:Copper homeostasis protein cutC homolog n=1 Tax=Candidatus Avipropionibacterium avicola TaxID=2840701 RepID=A0A9D1GZU7_9ACTN|nr:copper homeostasis protein CutC [Candidatus Avipropionibacterium avicola]
MTRPLLEVIVLHDNDAQRAEGGGADRLELVGSMDHGGLSPEPATVEKTCAATDLPVRVMVRLRDGYGTDGGEVTRLVGLARSYEDAGAAGLVFGYLNAHSEIDLSVMTELVRATDLPWTFHRAVDACLDQDKAWQLLPQLGCDQVLTAGSARGVEEGLDDLLARARSDERIAAMIVAGGGLQTDHVPWLLRAGVRSFHVGSRVRPTSSYKAYVDDELVGMWRSLLDRTDRKLTAATEAGGS